MCSIGVIMQETIGAEMEPLGLSIAGPSASSTLRPKPADPFFIVVILLDVELRVKHRPMWRCSRAYLFTSSLETFRLFLIAAQGGHHFEVFGF